MKKNFPSTETWKNLKLLFSWETAHNGKSLISAFEEFPVSTNKTFNMTATLGTRRSFPGI